uniref:SH2 domain-containing protein n=1 Tax=Strongyloides venezuelensis TaxID=75913 RepID=A0A0K0EXK7_STRVS
MVSIVKNLKVTSSVNFFGKILNVKEDRSSLITKAKWPKFLDYYTEGGDSGSIMTSCVHTEWIDNKGSVTFSTLDVFDIVKKSENNIFEISPSFIKALDGDIIYSSDKNFLIVFKVSIRGEEDFIGCVFDGEKNEVLINKGILHTPPILYQETGDIKILQRMTNGISFEKLNLSMLRMNIEGNNINSNLITFTEESCEQSDKIAVKINDYVNTIKGVNTPSLLKAHETMKCFDGLEVIKIDNNFREVPVGTKWKNSVFENKSKQLSQNFKMKWITEKDEPRVTKIGFHGLSGSFEGEYGEPGIMYREEFKTYSYKLLMARPDGTFFLRSLTPDTGFIISVVPSNESGRPDFSRLHNILVPYGYGIRLAPLVWHSVPFPQECKSSVTLQEVICETNANVVINLEELSYPWLEIYSGN